MNNILSILEMNKDLIFKIAIGVVIFIGVIILAIFIKKHKAICFTIVIFVCLILGFYFCNSSFGFHFSNDLSRDSIRSDYDSDNYIVHKDKDKTIYYTKAFVDGEFVSDEGDIFCVEKKLFFYVNSKPKTYNYEITLNEDSLTNNQINVVVKEIKLSNSYFYMIKLDYVEKKIDPATGLVTITKLYPEEVKISGTSMTMDELYFTESTEKLSTLEIYGETATLKK